MSFGSGRYTFDVAQDWLQSPSADWSWGWIPGVACDSRDRVFVYSRSAAPLTVFDRVGRYLETWGEGILVPNCAHGIFIDADDNVFCTDSSNHCVYKFDRAGKLVMTIGTPGKAAATDGEPFNKPTDLAVASTGELIISDGYGNFRVHKYSADGTLLLSWGEQGSGPGQFALSHCVRIDSQDRIWHCDRENNRLQIFDLQGRFLDEWTGLLRPNTVFFVHDPELDAEVVLVAELGRQLSIYTLDGELLTKWGGGAGPSQKPGEFIGGPHGMWIDSRGDLYLGEVELGEVGRLQKYVRQG